MPKTSTRRKGKTNQAAGTRKTKVNAKGNVKEKTLKPAKKLPRARLKIEELENVLSQMQACSWVTINFFITRDSTFAIYVFEEGHVRVTNSTTNRFIELSASVSPNMIVYSYKMGLEGLHDSYFTFSYASPYMSRSFDQFCFL